jgi:hypothetical protein
MILNTFLDFVVVIIITIIFAVLLDMGGLRSGKLT